MKKLLLIVLAPLAFIGAVNTYNQVSWWMNSSAGFPDSPGQAVYDYLLSMPPKHDEGMTVRRFMWEGLVGW